MLMLIDKKSSPKSFKIATTFFCYICAGYKAAVAVDRGRGFHFLLDVFITMIGSTFTCTIPVAISHSPPVSVGTVDQNVLVVFLKRQVLVSRWQKILQSNDNPLGIRVYLEEILLTLLIMSLS